MIRITASLSLDEQEIQERFIRASGAGGQNVNKLASAVELRFDVRHSVSLPETVRARLAALAGRRINQMGVLVIKAQRYRTQERNRRDAMDRLIALIRRAAEPVARRRTTKPPASSRAERRDTKARRALVKQRRAKPELDF